MVFSVVLASGAGIAVTFAAGPYDGAWSGSASGSVGAAGSRCSAIVSATVADNEMKGTAVFGSINAPFTGTIASDGKFDGKMGASREFTGAFSGNSFSGSFVAPSPACKVVTVVLHRP
jgi:hypothetical protein